MSTDPDVTFDRTSSELAPYQTWVSPGLNGRCDDGETCQLCDWSIPASVSGSAPHLLNINVAPDYEMTGNRCPTADEAVTIDVPGIGEITSLLNAVELPNRGGNKNGHCESNETCLFTPNAGSYQGHGKLVSKPDCKPIESGIISNVTFLEYEHNGT